MSKFTKSSEGVEELRHEFNYWSGVLESRSVQMAYGVIAANWVIHEQTGILNSDGALLSVLVAVGFLAVQLTMTRKMATLHGDRIDFARTSKGEWEQEFETRASTEWPYTKEIESYGARIRVLRIVLPGLSGVLFAIGAAEVYF